MGVRGCSPSRSQSKASKHQQEENPERANSEEEYPFLLGLSKSHPCRCQGAETRLCRALTGTSWVCVNTGLWGVLEGTRDVPRGQEGKGDPEVLWEHPCAQQ